MLKMLIWSLWLLEHDKFLVSRSGYTGEDGFEIYGDHQDIISLTENY